MASLDIFNSDVFGLTSLSLAVEKVPYQPMLLGEMGIFTPKPITTLNFGIESRQGVLTLIPNSERGAPPSQAGSIRRVVRDFRTGRLIKDDQIHSHEIIGVRSFGTESEMQTVMEMVAQRQLALRNDLELTLENQRLGAVQGVVIDADGSTTIIDWYAAFGLSVPSEIAFTNSAVTTALGMIPFLNANVVRPMRRSVGAANFGAINALCGDNFFDWLTSHADVKATYLNWQAAADLRQSRAFESFSFGGINWINYRGTDDNSTVAIGTSKVRFFTSGVPGLFQHIMSPAESMDAVGTLGRPTYSQILNDPTGRNAFVTLEVAAYPAMVCSRPESLLRGAYS